MQIPLSSWSSLVELPHRPLGGGLINDTFSVGSPPVAVVQRLHTIFDPILHEDIEAITAHIANKGLVTPRLLRTDDGALWTLDGEERCWRALSWVPGVSVERLDSAQRARTAGDLVGRWHRATEDLQHTFAFTRSGAHDTDQHMTTLVRALDRHTGHRLRDEVGPLADQILTGWAAWDGRLEGPTRIAHGDLKISNLRFDDQGGGICLLDLDTMAALSMDIEMGDALRSWCNPAGEDVEEASFDSALFEAAMGGWLAVNPQPEEERTAIVHGVERICLELASRFAADALNESYFGWNPEMCVSRGAHNLLRARGQASLARSVQEQSSALHAMIR